MKLFKSTKNATRYGAQAAAHPHVYPIRNLDEMVAALKDSSKHAGDKIAPFALENESEIISSIPATYGEALGEDIRNFLDTAGRLAQTAIDEAGMAITRTLDPLFDSAAEFFNGPAPSITFTDVDSDADDTILSAQL